MNTTKQIALGEYIFSRIDNDTYLLSLHQSLVFNYSRRLFKRSDLAEREVNIADALSFVDILSKSTGTNLTERHHTRAQEMSALLKELYPDNPLVERALRDTLANTGNYLGLAAQEADYIPDFSLDKIALGVNRHYLRLPSEDAGEYFPAQKEIVEGFGASSLSYSAPTSMGKTFMMRTFIKSLVYSGSALNFAILLPTKALLSEVSSELISSLQGLLESRDYRVVTSVGSFALETSHNFIFVVTPERMLYILNEHPDLTLDYLFIDEAQKVSAEDGRSAYYYKLISEVTERRGDAHIVFASPNIPNPEIYLRLGAASSATSESTPLAIRCQYSPVSQQQYLVDLQTGSAEAFDEYSQEFISICNIGQRQTLNDLIDRVGKNKLNLVYCNSRRDTVQYAISYANRRSMTEDQVLLQLASDIRKEIHEEYYLANLLERGVAYHTGYLPASVRKRLEDCYREGKIGTLFSTSTLLEGVNLPADNLFIASSKKGLSVLRPVDFKNLVGRVGRILYNLRGNAFAVVMPDPKRTEDRVRFESLMKKEVDPQGLSVSTAFSKPQKLHIVDSLVDNADFIPKFREDQSERSYDLMRKTGMVLLDDLLSDKDSFTREEFAPFLAPEKERAIRERYSKVDQTISEDISITVDQFESLEGLIAAGIQYPPLQPNGSGADYNELLCFLEALAGAFKWNVYESKTLGKKNEFGEYRSLRYYANILNQWVRGQGIGSLVRNIIGWHERSKASVRIDWDTYEPYDGTGKHKNIVIDNLFHDINEVLLFSLSNYFKKFSEEYKRQHGIDIIDNDWYEYVEYGTTDSTSIFLQRIGFEKEASDYIRTHASEYISYSDGKMRLKKDKLLNCSNELVASNTKDIQFNSPELFE